jgi:uncharacterized membrane protein (UPF0127 family)
VGVVGLGKRMQAVLAADGRVVCERCAVADGFRSRLRGLLGRRELPQGDGLLLSPSSSVHTLFMRFPIDVVFLDGDLRVVAVADDVRPWRLAARKGARHVLELPAGEARRRGLEAGQQLSLAGSKGPDSERARRVRGESAVELDEGDRAKAPAADELRARSRLRGRADGPDARRHRMTTSTDGLDGRTASAQDLVGTCSRGRTRREMKGHAAERDDLGRQRGTRGVSSA